MKVNLDPKARNWEFLKLCTISVILMMLLGYITWAAIFDKTFMGFITNYIKIKDIQNFVLFIQAPPARFFIALCSFIGFCYPFAEFVRLILAWMRGQRVITTFFAPWTKNYELTPEYIEWHENYEKSKQLEKECKEAHIKHLERMYGVNTPEFHKAVYEEEMEALAARVREQKERQAEMDRNRLDSLEREMSRLRNENEQLKNRKLTYAETMPTYNERERIRNEARIFADEVNRMNRKSLFK
jgi:hypothetical protein